MKRQIFGRKVGTSTDLVLLIEASGATTGGRKVDPGQLRQLEIDSTHRSVGVLRERNVGGYVLFGDDPTHYVFSPSQDFVYPAMF